MLSLKKNNTALVLWTDRWSSKVIGLSKDLIDKDYDCHGDDIDDWDTEGDMPTEPGLYTFKVCFSEDPEDGEFWLTNPKVIYDFGKVDGLLHV